MILLESLLVALSTYSVVPVPQFDWNDRNMKYAICFFPTVGVLCGGALWGWLVLAQKLNISSLLFAAVAACLPLFITGGIHMDGYMDTVDALASHQSRERKLEILKDPHCGAFAVIYCGIYLLMYVGFIYEIYEAQEMMVLCPMFVLSRTLSALCAVTMPNARKAGMLCAYTQNTEKHHAVVSLAAVLLVCSILILWLSPLVGGTMLLGALLSVLLYYKLAMGQFGGVTGDTAGFFLQICELSCIVGAWIGSCMTEWIF